MTNHHSNKEILHSIKSVEDNEGDRMDKKRLIKDSVNKTTHLQFDSDDEGKEFNDKDILNVEEDFNEKQIPKKKKKLQKLQIELITTNDARFRLSEQFLNDKDKTMDDEEEIDNNEISFEDEKKNSLAILDQITSAKSFVAKPKSKMIRFDPSKTEHRIYELDSETQTNGNDLNTSEEIKPKSILRQTKETTPKIDSTRTYDFDQSKLKSMFDKTLNPTTNSTNNGHFQFQFFNHEQPVTLPVPKTFPVAKPTSKTVLNKLNDSSSDEDDNGKMSLSTEPEVTDQIKNQTFFFFDIDDRLKDGLESFVRTEELNELERTWSTKRKEIGEALRTKHRKAIQRKDRHRVFNHRRRQHQHSSSNPTPKTAIN